MTAETTQWLTFYQALNWVGDHCGGYIADHFLNIVSEVHNKAYREYAEKIGYCPTQLTFFKESFSEVIEPMLEKLNELECEILIRAVAYDEYTEDFCCYMFLIETPNSES